MADKRKFWTKEETITLLKMRKQNFSYDQIGKVLGRTRSECNARYFTWKTRRKIHNISEADIAQAHAAYRESLARVAPPANQNFTALICGDPPPDRSALNLRKTKALGG